MLKKFLALLISVSTILSCFTLGASAREGDGCVKSHFPPTGYTLQETREGDCLTDAAVTSTLVNCVSWIPGIGTIAWVIDKALTAEWIIESIQDGKLHTTYTAYTYKNASGSLSWTHIIFYCESDDPSGIYRKYVGCKVET